MHASSPSESSAIERIRGAYQQLPPEEKAKLVRFIARRRFTDDVFENWRKKSGLETSDILQDVAEERQSEPVRERLDAALLEAGNEELLVEAVTKYLAGSDPELIASFSTWVAEAKSQAGEADPAASVAAPEGLKNHPRAGLVEALVRGGLLAPAAEAEVRPQAAPAAELPAVTSSNPAPLPPAAEIRRLPGDKIAALGQLDELEELMESIDGDVARIRDLKGALDLGALERKLRRASTLSVGLHAFAAEAGTWESAKGFRELLESIPDPHAIWAGALADFLESLPLQHPLRRKREAAEATREAAVGELRNFATLGGIEEEVPGPFEDPGTWWNWAVALSGEEFDAVEEWCSANSLDHLADLIAELWSFVAGSERSEHHADAASQASAPNGRGSLIAAMEAAQKQAASVVPGDAPAE